MLELGHVRAGIVQTSAHTATVSRLVLKSVSILESARIRDSSHGSVSLNVAKVEVLHSGQNLDGIDNLTAKELSRWEESKRKTKKINETRAKSSKNPFRSARRSELFPISSRVESLC
jgi:hypothetical protein